jgi:hypothetical protein
MSLDFILDGNDLAVAGGDLAIGPVGDDNAKLLLATSKGDWKGSPLTGIGVVRFLNAPDGRALEREVRIQLEADGFTCRSVQLLSDKLKIDAAWPEL